MHPPMSARRRLRRLDHEGCDLRRRRADDPESAALGKLYEFAGWRLYILRREALAPLHGYNGGL
jgi:hypothetical protein